MIRFFLVFVLSGFLTTAVTGQNSYTLKGGGNYNYLGYDFEGGYGDHFGYTFGAAAAFTVRPGFMISPELNFSRRTIELFTPVYLKQEYFENDVLLRLNYIDVPLHLGMGTFYETETGATSFFFLYAGPQVSFLAGQHNKLISEKNKFDLADVDAVNNTLIGLNLGASLGHNNLYVDVRYLLPISSFFSTEDYSERMHSMSITVGISILSGVKGSSGQ